MSDFRSLRVYHETVRQLRDISRITADLRFGDLSSQLRRAAISVVSNLAEGAGRGSDAEFVRFLHIARASNDEIAAQLDILAALGGADASALLERNSIIGRQISGLIRYLRRSDR